MFERHSTLRYLSFFPSASREEARNIDDVSAEILPQLQRAASLLVMKGQGWECNFNGDPERNGGGLVCAILIAPTFCAARYSDANWT